MRVSLEARVRKHTEDISRSLEKICNIIDEHAEYYEAEDYEDSWMVPIPGFLSLIPMRYRASGYVLELTAMVSCL